jgi:hypothetical protein
VAERISFCIASVICVALAIAWVRGGVRAFLGTALLAAGWPVILQILRLLFCFCADPSAALRASYRPVRRVGPAIRDFELLLLL